MPNHRMNKAIAGYHMLMILSSVDRKYSVEEENIIREYLVNEFPIQIPLDNEMDIISNLKNVDKLPHFEKCMDDFYDDATEEDRNNFLEFAIALVKADDDISKEENQFLNRLFEVWEPETE